MLKTLGVPFRVVVSDFEETKIKEKNPEIRARKIAFAKAKKVAEKHTGIIISADTFTFYMGKILEKPKSLKEAKKMLRQISENKTICYTGFCFLNTKNQETFSKTAVTEVVFRKIYQKEIERYVKVFPVTDWAAAYAASELYVLGIIKSVSGSLTGLTHGLPTEWLIPLLKKSGYEPKPFLLQ
ncbi:Maf family protein [Candidatus Microgenomates bacterium]|nr:Maf family protein [Candidatus Microgenomates bacterium]